MRCWVFEGLEQYFQPYGLTALHVKGSQLKPPVITRICDLSISRARYHTSLKLYSKLKYNYSSGNSNENITTLLLTITTLLSCNNTSVSRAKYAIWYHLHNLKNVKTRMEECYLK